MWYETCPSCGAEIEVYDAPSSLIWSCFCSKCGWNDGYRYFEDGDIIYKMTEKEARKRRIIEDCPKCTSYMTKYEKNKWGACVSCAFDRKDDGTIIKKKK
jgi:Zn finger protein HypA/HybF involved in hydrogenase expression